MANNPYTGSRRNKEDVIRNLKYKQQNGGDSPYLRQQIHNAEGYLERYKRQEQDWNRNHK